MFIMSVLYLQLAVYGIGSIFSALMGLDVIYDPFFVFLIGGLLICISELVISRRVMKYKEEDTAC